MALAAIFGCFPCEPVLGIQSRQSEAALPRGKIQVLIESLGDGNATQRRRATQELFELGDVARGELLRASTHQNLEIRRRASYLLSLLDLGVETNAEPEEVQQLLQFRRGSDGFRYRVLRELMAERDFARVLRLCDSVEPSFQSRWLSTNWRSHRIYDRDVLDLESRQGWPLTFHPVLWNYQWRDNLLYARAIGQVPEQLEQLTEQLHRQADERRPEIARAVYALRVLGQNSNAGLDVENPGLDDWQVQELRWTELARRGSWQALWAEVQSEPGQTWLTAAQCMLLAQLAGDQPAVESQFFSREIPTSVSAGDAAAGQNRFGSSHAEIELRLALALGAYERFEDILPSCSVQTQLDILLALNRPDEALAAVGIEQIRADGPQWMHQRSRQIEMAVGDLRSKFDNEVYRQLRSDLYLALAVIGVAAELGERETSRRMALELATVFAGFDSRVTWGRSAFLTTVAGIGDAEFYWAMAGRLYRPEEARAAWRDLFQADASLARVWNDLLNGSVPQYREASWEERLLVLGWLVRHPLAVGESVRRSEFPLAEFVRPGGAGQTEAWADLYAKTADVGKLAEAVLPAGSLHLVRPSEQYLAVAKIAARHGDVLLETRFAMLAGDAGLGSAYYWLAVRQLCRGQRQSAWVLLERAAISGSPQAEIMQAYVRAVANDSDARSDIELQKARLQLLVRRFDSDLIQDLRRWGQGEELQRLAEYRLETDDALRMTSDSEKWSEVLRAELRADSVRRLELERNCLFRNLQQQPVGPPTRWLERGQAPRLLAIVHQIEAGEIGLAEKAWNALLRSHPENVELIRFVYPALMRSGYEAEASQLAGRIMDSMRATLGRYPQSPRALRNLAEAHLLLGGDLELAAAMSSKAVLLSGAADAWCVAVECAAAGDGGEVRARQMLGIALSIRPESPELLWLDHNLLQLVR